MSRFWAFALVGLLMFADRTSASDLIYQSIDPAFGANLFDGPLSRTE